MPLHRALRRELPEHRRFSHFMQGLNRIFARGFHRLKVLSPCPVPAEGPVILVCNHTSGLDPQLIQSCCRRLITWMIAREYYSKPGIRWLLGRLGAIPLDRGGRDMAAMRAALRALHDGQVLGIFPEGRIETGDELMEFQTGVALLAIRSGAPVYCAWLDGTQRRRAMLRAFLLPQRARIRFASEPIRFESSESDREALEEATARIKGEIERLQSES